MEGKNQQGHCSYDDQVNYTTSVPSNGGPQNPMQRISQEPPMEIQFPEIAPPAEEPLDLSHELAEEPLDLNLELSLGGLYKEIEKNNVILPPRQPPLPPYYTTDDINLGEVASYLQEQEMRRFEAYRRSILRRRARERAEAKKAAAAAAASPQAPPPAAAQPPKPITLPRVVASDVEKRELCRPVEKMNALGEFSGEKILEVCIGASTLATGRSSSSQQPWTSHQPNSEVKANAAKAVYGKSAIMIENISHDEQNKRPRLPNVVQNSNAHQESSNDNGVRGMKQLLTVTTTGDGPQGKKVDGFLYEHSKGGHIFIVCSCHGIFLSPTDFVKHANHTDWSNPMKHIAVGSPLPPPF